MHVKAPRGISNEDYGKFVDDDYGVLEQLSVAHSRVEDVLIYLDESGLDSPAQREVALSQIDSMIYLLNRIKAEYLKEDS